MGMARMRMLKYLAPAALILGLAVGMALVRADDPPKYSIKDVMKMAHKGDPSLYKKVVNGDGNKDDKDTLVTLYAALAADHPKVNDDDDWKMRTQAMLAAAKDVQADKPGAADALKKAAACGDCHKNHRPPNP